MLRFLSALVISTILALTALAAPESGSGSRTVLCLGDSLTEGYELPTGEAWPAKLEKALRDKGRQDIKVVNAGISGSTTASGPGRLKWHLKAKPRPELLVLALGANDGLRGVEAAAIEKNLSETIELAKGQGMKVLLAGMRIPPNYGQKYSDEFAAVFPRLADKHSVPLIPFLLAGVAGEKHLNLKDGIHPNAAGHDLMAKLVLPFLEPML